MTFLDEIRAQAALVAALPEPVAYVVLDPSCPLGVLEDARDADGRRYLLTSPAILDEMQHRKYGGIDVAADPFGVVGRLSAIPVRRRQDLHEGWPDVPQPQPRR